MANAAVQPTLNLGFASTTLAVAGVALQRESPLLKGFPRHPFSLRKPNEESAMPAIIDLTDQTFGKLKVLRRSDDSSDGRTRWVCKCEGAGRNCKKKVTVNGDSLKRGLTTSCGNHRTAHNFVDLTGQTFGKLKVLGRGKAAADGRYRWKCKCKVCGRTVSVQAGNLARLPQGCGRCRKKTRAAHRSDGQEVRALEGSAESAEEEERRWRHSLVV